MKAIIACEMLTNEVQRAMRATRKDYPIYWLERGLHEHPEKLHDALQLKINELSETVIMFAFGLCGNAMHGLVSTDKTLVIPRFHDCLNMLLVSETGGRRSTDPDSLYYTGAWLDSDFTLLNQYERFKAKRGEEKAKRAYASMLANYRGLHMIDTGVPIDHKTIKRAQDTAETFNLKYGEIEGSNRVLDRLFAGDWDEDILVYPPGEQVNLRDFFTEFSD